MSLVAVDLAFLDSTFWRQPEFWKHASIPFVAAVVGWFTNWLAIRLTFHPIEPWGKPPFLGWHGIIPSKARKMATTFVDSTMHRLGSFPELFANMDPDLISAHIVSTVEPKLPRYTDEVIFWTGNGAVWRATPRAIKERVYQRVQGRIPVLVESIMEEAGRDIEGLVDFRHMIVHQLVTDRALLNRLFLESGRAEFRFLIRSGAYFGFLFGLVQLGVWIFYPAGWVLPVFGLIVGLATNWIALNLIFRPLEPTRIGPWTVQGLFLKRQSEVARVWTRLVTREIVTLRRIMHSMLHGPRRERARSLIRRHIEPVVDEAMGLLRPAARLTIGSEGLDDIRRKVGDKALEVANTPFENWHFDEERSQVVEDLLYERMESLPPVEFQDLLRPCFQEDEWKLILLGAVLGLAAGIAQWLLVFGGVS